MKKLKIKNFVIDVDGVLNTGQFIYDDKLKKYKIFGPDDSDALKILSKYLSINFISGDKRGFKISERRVNDMGFKINYVSTLKRIEWIDKNFNVNQTVYMGDGIFDYLVFRKVAYSICPKNSDENCLKNANYITRRKSAERVISEACSHLLKKFFKTSVEKILK